MEKLTPPLLPSSLITKGMGMDIEKLKELAKKKKPGNRLIKMEGKVFGSLTVVSRAEYKGACAAWHCLCSCGKTSVVTGDSLRRGKTVSCGCSKTKKIVEYNAKHWMSRSTEYVIWSSMKQRCNDPKNARYKDYGGRGIKVCKEWDDFEKFLIDMGMRPKDMTIDRIDNEKGYSKDNCRWATRAEQNRNTRRNVLIVFNGEGKILSDWAKTLGIAVASLSERLERMPAEKALTMPKHGRKLASSRKDAPNER